MLQSNNSTPTMQQHQSQIMSSGTRRMIVGIPARVATVTLEGENPLRAAMTAREQAMFEDASKKRRLFEGQDDSLLFTKYFTDQKNDSGKPIAPVAFSMDPKGYGSQLLSWLLLHILFALRTSHMTYDGISLSGSNWTLDREAWYDGGIPFSPLKKWNPAA